MYCRRMLKDFFKVFVYTTVYTQTRKFKIIEKLNTEKEAKLPNFDTQTYRDKIVHRNSRAD